MTVQATFCATLVDEWVRAGISDAVVCPGSRSTPMALALATAASEGPLRLHVHLDERSAGFFGLGLGMATGRPAVVLTTSGTATAELLPAIVEAHHSRVPLIVCTADRPPELHGVGAPQTIDQDTLYGGGVLRWRCDPGPADGLPPASWRSLGARAVAAATSGPQGPGPVHCNLMFRDPLVATPGPLPPGRDDGAPWHGRAGGLPTTELDDGWAGRLADRRGLMVAGGGLDDPGAVVALAAHLGWPVVADPRSGCRGQGPNVVAAFDLLVRADHWAGAHRPEVVVRFGAPPASKVLAAWLAQVGADQILVDPWGAWLDPEREAATLVASSPGAFCRRRLGEAPAPAPSGWLSAWTEAEASAQDAVASVLATHHEPTEPGVARLLTSVLGPEATLVVSSSMPIRDVEWFGDPSCRARVVANRGANGIDGMVSTALGVAAGAGGPTAALLGDLAFLHDAGGLLWAGRRDIDLTIVVVDNDGGGIFSFLPQAGELPSSRFEQLFGTPHGIDLGVLAAAHGLPVTTVAAAAEVGPAVVHSMRLGGVRIVLVRTDRVANVAVHDELNAAVDRALR